MNFTKPSLWVRFMLPLSILLIFVTSLMGQTDPCATDVTPPVFANCPANITLATTTTTAVANWTQPTATDNCSTPSVSSNYNAGFAFPAGTTTVTYTASDAKNNRAVCRFNVYVVPINNSCRQSDSLQLVSLYNATNGANWTYKWNLNTPIHTWYGVYFNADGCVNAIALTLNNLSGTIPNLNLPNLESLSLGGNQLIGNIPNFNLPKLIRLNFQENQLNGSIPNFNLPNLEELGLNKNQLSGTIPNFNFPKIRVLSLALNQLSGNLPDLNFPNINALYLSYNLFSGCIPASFKSFCGKIVDISNNPNLATQDFNAFCGSNAGACPPPATANCTSKSNAPWSEWIANVTLANLNNASEKTRSDRYAVGYSDWTDKAATLTKGQSYPLSITPGLSWSGYQTNLFFRSWIDFNNNGIFEDTEKVLEQNNGNQSVTQSITIPTTAVTGTVRMRVSMKKDAFPTVCETFAAGEVEDYMVVVQSASTGSCTPSVPTKLYAKDINATTAKLIWSKVNNALEYEYQMLYDDTSQPNGGALISSGILTDTFVNITLVQGRLRAIVRSRCVASGTWSAWSLATHFNQQFETCTQSARTAFVEDFESSSYASPQGFNLPLCWNKLTYHAPTVYEAWTDVRITSRGTVGNTTKRVIMFRSTPMTDSALIMLVSPEISNLSAGTNRLRFKAANTFGSEAAGNALIQIGTLSNPFDASSFTSMGQYAIGGNAFTEYIVDFATYHGSDRYIVFKYISSGGDFYRSLEIDDVAWETRPSNPNLPDLTLANLTMPTPSVQQGQNMNYNVTIKNKGTASVGNSFNVRTYISSDNVFSSDDIGSSGIGVAPNQIIPAGDSLNQSSFVIIPSTLAAGQYYLILRADDTNLITESNENNNILASTTSFTVTATTPPTTNCASKSNAPWNEWIANVTLANLNNATSKTRDDRFVVGYSDWKDKTATVTKGQSYPLSITPGLSWSGYQTNLFFRAWIDYNKNGTYEDTELVLEKNSVSSTVNQSVTIPTTATTGTTILRISMKKDAYPTTCETFAAGEVEDYSVLIQDGGIDPCATDATPPVFQNCPANINLTTTATTAIATWAAPTATDNCGTPSVSSNFSSGQSFPIGSTSVTYTAKDAKNNAATCSFNIIVTASATCTPVTPSKIFAKDITATTATLVWSKVNNAFQYEYQLLYDDTSQPGGGAFLSSGIVNDTFANITLIQGRLRAIVRSRCTANGTWSSWSNATMFNLFSEPCTQGARTAFVEDFESGSYSSPQGFNLPVCWTKLTYHAPTVNESWVDVRLTSRGTLGNATKRAIMFRSTPLDSSLILMISPEIANLSAGTNRLRFKAANTWGSQLSGSGRIQIGTMSNIYDGSTFVPFGNPTVITDNNFREYIVDFTTYNGNNRFIAFKYLDAGGDQFRSLEIDDVVWETKPVTTASTDIELTIASNPATYRQWTTNTVRVTAKNIGTTTMTNVKIDLKRPAKMAFGGTRTPSVGTFNDYCAGGIECSEWTIPSLAAGATATLDAPFFVLDAIAPIVVTTNLLASIPTDGNATNNVASVSLSPQMAAAQSVSQKPTQLIPIVIQRIAPNPTDGELRVQLESLDAREVTFEFYNSLGKVVKSEKKAVEKGLNRLEFSVYDFEQGLYFVTPSTSQGHKVPTKFVKL